MKICPSTIALKWEYESPQLNRIPKYERNISDVEMAKITTLENRWKVTQGFFMFRFDLAAKIMAVIEIKLFI